jgi:hypothetical protein
MIRLGNQIRLTPREIARLEMITGFFTRRCENHGGF